MTVKVEDSVIIIAANEEEYLQEDMLDVLHRATETLREAYYVKGEEGKFKRHFHVRPDTLLRLNLSLEVIEDDS